MYEREKRMIWGDGFKMRYWNYQNMGKAALEFLVVSIHPWPMGENAVYREGVTVWMFLRFYLLVRVIKDHSTVYRQRKQIVEENFQQSAAPMFNSWLSMQIVFSHSPDVSLVVFCMWSLGVFSISTYLCERDHNPDDFTFLNTTWYVYTTFLTMDIAEYTVDTWGARAVTCLLIAAGVVMNTLVVVAILDNITLDAKGRVALAYVHRTAAQDSIRRAAGAFIVSWVRWQVVKYKSLDAANWSKHRLHVAVALENMRTARYKKQITEQSLGDPVLDKLQSLDLGIMKIYHQITPKDSTTNHTTASSTPARSTASLREQPPMARNRRKSSMLRAAPATSSAVLLRSTSSAEASTSTSMQPCDPDNNSLRTELSKLAAHQEETLAQNKAIIEALQKLLQ
ncbi:hypothetical protein, variant [Aphanomyces invadans]|nr:hypothetical protein, variant [Aphanomyces invadans]ETW07781.1 hypothetical protein, variant [Aphanomyces invadans]|eukprot:XP_008863874.1 hypothetical protein, variant [Aphanomyces invadans]